MDLLPQAKVLRTGSDGNPFGMEATAGIEPA
jgi:hypothetical protein